MNDRDGQCWWIEAGRCSEWFCCPVLWSLKGAGIGDCWSYSSCSAAHCLQSMSNRSMLASLQKATAFHLQSIHFNFPLCWLYILCFCLSALVHTSSLFPLSLFSLSLSPVPKHLHLSLSFRSLLMFPQREFGGQAGNSPRCSFGPPPSGIQTRGNGS